jgi:hypothetical protein
VTGIIWHAIAATWHSATGGLDQVASISPDGKTTPTLGRQRGFFQDLFGNIGSVGAPGTGGGGGANTGTGRTRP